MHIARFLAIALAHGAQRAPLLGVALIFGSRDSFLLLSRLAAKLPTYNCMSWWRAGCRKRKGRA